jgi:hypothetical protein
VLALAPTPRAQRLRVLTRVATLRNMTGVMIWMDASAELAWSLDIGSQAILRLLPPSSCGGTGGVRSGLLPKNHR